MHVQCTLKIDSRKLSPSLIGSFLTELTFLNQMSIFFFPEIRIIAGSVESKKKILRNLGHNVLELCNVIIQIRLTTSKMKRDI